MFNLVTQLPYLNVCGICTYIGCPSILRSDCGTENTSLAAAQMALRHEHHDAFSGDKSFRFGSSTTNTVSSFFKKRLNVYICQNRELKVGGRN